ncbi:hypothetical protein LRS11_09030 [Pseudomonas sp. J452]|uniref:hypothetical protein n=1 Tax=Pseudomonas sp. J452 TaxID=2898441 RepID=UPI0021AE2409|nr:hypothetical protein [Pseudomonas sp. J452]UUY10149.1 hypothetical protein LRS11_09030 [Pseudomonas sp. J452]
MAHSSCWQAASVAKVNARAQQIKRACGEQESSVGFVSQVNSRQWRRAGTGPRGAVLFRQQQKTRRSGFFSDHSDILSAAVLAMVDHP